jgi:hypothetical protein
MDATQGKEKASRDRRRQGHPPAQELDPFNQMLAVIETRAHLELLVAQGRLASTSEDGVTCYQAAGPPG